MNCPLPVNHNDSVHDQNNPKHSNHFGSGDTAKAAGKEAELTKVFRRFDGNRDGRLSRQEVRNAFESLGAYFPTYRAIMALLEADANGDGYINEAEMKDLIHYASNCGFPAE